MIATETLASTPAPEDTYAITTILSLILLPLYHLVLRCIQPFIRGFSDVIDGWVSPIFICFCHAYILLFILFFHTINGTIWLIGVCFDFIFCLIGFVFHWLTVTAPCWLFDLILRVATTSSDDINHAATDTRWFLKHAAFVLGQAAYAICYGITYGSIWLINLFSLGAAVVLWVALGFAMIVGFFLLLFVGIPWLLLRVWRPVCMARTWVFTRVLRVWQACRARMAGAGGKESLLPMHSKVYDVVPALDADMKTSEQEKIS